METGFEWISHYGYGALFVSLVLGIVGPPVSDEIVLTFVGYLCFKGELHVVPALGTAFLGSASGITLSYILGRVVGAQIVVKWGPYVHLNPDHIAKTQRWITRWGKYTLLIAYYIPGVRHLAMLFVGASLLSPRVFVPFAYTGAFLWSATFLGLGYLAGEEWNQLSSVPHPTLVIGAILIILLLVSVLLVMRRRGSLS